MIGSWAGAMGQSQFMPSSYLSYAVNWRGDGRREIWNRREDVLDTIANYLSRVGWRRDQGWGREVTLPPGFDRSLASLDVTKSLAGWQRLDVRRAGGRGLPPGKGAAAGLAPRGSGGAGAPRRDNSRAHEQ